METFTTQSIINIVLGIGGILGIVFGAYHYFRNPQIRSDKIDALLELSMKNLSVKFDEKFKAIEGQIVRLETNHIHTIDTKIDANKQSINLLAIQVGKLETIIDERIPRKTL